ncbi:AhpC/TSA family protein [Salipaludibacillus daqingensis]|uniref:AhpC/TSA family protein n=1 Tax=Salipaludibacillus daqingensis TaxID=3041001 RepID=UPI00247563AE|nr:AhpC/TSA family protein [Salipaludibacillus daqingensis]
MREHEDEITKEEVQIIVIAPSKGSFVSQFLDAFGPYPFPFYGDPKRHAYREMGHQTAPKLKLLSMAAFAFVTGKVKNFLPKEASQNAIVKKSMKTQDVYIQGGTWFFNENGKVIWKHIDKMPDDHASINEIKNQVTKTYTTE